MIFLFLFLGGDVGDTYGSVFNTDKMFGSGGFGATTSYGSGNCR